MVKSIFLYICLLSIYGCSNRYEQKISPRANVSLYINEPDGTKVISDKECIINISESLLGSKEIGDNRDFTNKELKELLVASGWTPGSPWCSFTVKGILDHCDIPNKVTGWSPTSYNKNDVIYTDGEFKSSYKEEDIIVMSLSYNKYKNDKSRYKAIGHTGIVIDIDGEEVHTREGNAFRDNTNSNDGQEFCDKIRPLDNKIHLTGYGRKK